MNIRQKNHSKRKNNTASRRSFRRAASFWSALGGAFLIAFPTLFPALLLAGCAMGDSGDENDSPYVFETQFHSPQGGVEDFTVFGDSVYYSTFDGEFYQWTPGREAQKLDVEPFIPEPGSLIDSRTLQADLEGNLYVFYRVRGSRENNYSDANYLVKYDAAGKELARANVSHLTSQFIPYETAVDAEGRLYLMGIAGLLLFDETCSYAGAVQSPEGESVSWLAGDDEGHVYCCLVDTRAYEREVIREVVRGGEDTPIAFSENVTNNFQGGNYLATYGEKRFLTSMTNALYLYDAVADTQASLLQWVNCDINPASVQRFSTLADGRIIVNLREEDSTSELALLTEVPREQAAQKEIITLGVLQAGNSHLQHCVSQFNRNSPDCRIEIREYYDALLDSGQPDAMNEARTALNLDIVSGRCPDILVLEHDDLETYASKGLLEDLAPWLEENAHLEISDNVLESYTIGGRLCALPGSLQIRTIAGRTTSLGQLGGTRGWTLEEMMDYIDSHPDITAFSADAGQLLEYCLTFNQSYFVDWETHTCDFTTDEFIHLLEFCKRFSGTQTDDNKSVLNLMGRGNRALLYEVELVRPEDISLLTQALGADVTYIGFPTLDGQMGSLLEDCGGTCAISAKSRHKEEAWDFLECLLTDWGNPPKSFAALMGTQGFPTELGTREQYFAKVTENPYRILENGEPKMEGGKPVRYYFHSLVKNGVRVCFYVPLPEETDLICELLDSSTTARGSSRITSIVSEEAAAYFSGQKSAADVAAVIQNRVSLYLKEQK